MAFEINPQLRTRIDPLNNPGFGTSNNIFGASVSGNPNRMGYTQGGGNGLGMYDWSQLAAMGYDTSLFAPQMMQGDGSPAGVNPQQAADWLAANGLQWYQQAAPDGSMYRYMVDGSGNLVGEPQYINTDDDAFALAALAASGIVGGGIYAAGSAGAAGGAGAAAAGGGGNALSAGLAGGAGGGGLGGGAALGSATGGYGGLTGGSLLTGGALPATGGSGLTFAGAGGGGLAGYGGLGAAGGVGAAGGGAALGGGSAATGAGMSDGFMGISNGQWLNTGLMVANGLIGARAADKSADAINAAGAQSNALQREMFDYQKGLNAPLVDLRNSVLPQIQGLLSDPNSITTQPGYQFGLREGTNALNTGAASRGMTYSGNQGKALQRYGQDYAGTKLDQSLNRLTTVAGLSQVGANNNQTASASYGTGVGNTLQQMGNVRGSSYMGQANALTGAVGNIANDFQMQNLLRQYGGGG